ncbi:MAG: sigma-70 family RNA polymerase sigma factor [Oscillatoria sp. SIO1A7]|nr:sigma-70 family RNA polymerase sigma factor [Oscillatoria sp. SIO1A7]
MTLEDLAIEAQQHPAKSKKQRLALTKLIRAIEKSGKIYCEGRFNFPPEVYNDALQNALLDLWRKIYQYDRRKAKVITWFNNLLHWRFIEAIKAYKRSPRELSLDFANDASGTPLMDTVAQPVTSSRLGDRLWDCLQLDPEGLFEKKHVRGCPEANFQAIALRRLARTSWQDLSEDWDIPLSTLSVFYQRSCRSFAPKLREYLEDLDEG